MGSETVFRAGGENYTRKDLEGMDKILLQALFRERVHHGIEVRFYPLVVQNKPFPEDLGKDARIILEVWKERDLPLDSSDLKWGQTYLNLVEETKRGKKITLDDLPPRPEPFDEKEQSTVRKLIWERCSIRDWQEKEISDDLIKEVLEAGRAAPTGCNLTVVRFVVLKTQEELKTIASDIPTPAGKCVVIVIGYDKRIYPVVNHDKFVPHNQVLDCAAAGDHMLLMAHALGLGGVWLTQMVGAGEKFRQKSGVPEYFEPVFHIAIGWPGSGTIKSQRPPLEDLMVRVNLPR